MKTYCGIMPFYFYMCSVYCMDFTSFYIRKENTVNILCKYIDVKKSLCRLVPILKFVVLLFKAKKRITLCMEKCTVDSPFLWVQHTHFLQSAVGKVSFKNVFKSKH